MTVAEAKRVERVELVAVAVGVAGVTLMAWIVYAAHWFALLDGDAALYPLMSVEILRGHHYVYTVGQSHGGTLLTYLRAALFAVFGAGRFLAAFVNGLAMTAAVWLWSRFAGRVGGWVAALVTGLSLAAGSEVFIQYSLTDYYIGAVVCGGLLLGLAGRLAARERLKGGDLFAAGVACGFSLYICRFTAIYALLAFVFFVELGPRVRKAALIPGLRELRAPGRALLTATVIALAISIAAFFTDDRFLGANAEVTLKITCALGAAVWILHRWRLLAAAPGHVVALAAGAALGIFPHFLFNHLNPASVDRSTGLVRWSDFMAVRFETLRQLESILSRSDPGGFGLAALGGSALLLVLALSVGNGRDRRALAVALVFGLAPAVAAWGLLHTYMYFKVQYLYPAVAPLALALGLSAAALARRARLVWVAALLVATVPAAGLRDMVWIVTQPEIFTTSGLREQMAAWKVDVGTGAYDATYNVMWAYGGAVTLDPLGTSKFRQFAGKLAEAPRFACVYRPGDARPEQLRSSAYKVLAHAELRNGYAADLFERTK